MDYELLLYVLIIATVYPMACMTIFSLLYGFPLIKKVFELKGQNTKMLEAMKWFCRRVDKGEVRSVKTYNKFEEIIAEVEGDG